MALAPSIPRPSLLFPGAGALRLWSAAHCLPSSHHLGTGSTGRQRRRHDGRTRHYASSSPNSATPSGNPDSVSGPPESYVSLSTDPFFNLALEGHLFRTRPAGTPVCLVYRNDACVVVGRNQNPWKELNAVAMRENRIPLVRRQSGGGTVYHDHGNTNFSFHTPRETFDRRTHAEMVARALNGRPISLRHSKSEVADADRGAYVNGRGDICISVRPSFPHAPAAGSSEEEAWEERKISGSAYKLVSSRAYHHGTLLLSASLSSLGSSLHNSRGDALVTKGVASVRAKVANLSDAFPDRAEVLEHDAVARALVAEFWHAYAGRRSETDRVDERILDAPEMNEGRWKLREAYDELRSWEWVWGQTPEFTHRISYPAPGAGEGAGRLGGLHFDVEVHSKNGIILDAKLIGIPPQDTEAGSDGGDEQERRRRRSSEVARVVEEMVGKRYDEYAVTPPWALDMEGRSETKLQPRNETEAEVLRWLREVL